MCTAVTYYPAGHYFGRNLDLECSLNEHVLITPRNFPFRYRMASAQVHHCALIGIGIVADGYPLYFDACNEYGLCMAGLNFPGNAVYRKELDGFNNIAPFELLPWVLCQCKTVEEAKTLLNETNIIQEHFSTTYPNTPLHWIVSDKQHSITVESLAEGVRVWDNPVGVLTNNPPFTYHIQNLQNYLNLTNEEASNRFSEVLKLEPYSLGMGAIGLPGDLSSASRFVRAAFTKFNSRSFDSENDAVSQFFHILGSVAQCDGCTKTGNHYERTVYSSCCNMDLGIYYYTTYENSRIHAVSMFAENLNTFELISYPLMKEQEIWWVNK